MQSHADRSTLSEMRSALCASSANILGALTELIARQQARAHQHACWNRLEHDIARHLRAEEELLLPHFELVAPEDASHIRHGHQRVRAAMREISGDFEAGRYDRDKLEALLGWLRASARTEERKLYRWAEGAMRPARKSELIKRLRPATPLDGATWLR